MSDDFDLFKKEIAGVKKIKNEQVNLHQKNKKPTLSQQATKEAALGKRQSNDPNYLTTGFVEPVEPNDWLEYKSDGVQALVYKNLRLGKYPIEASIDLHRRTVKEARDDVFYFIKRCREHDKRLLLITHGKGERSEPKAVIKSHVNHWLQEVTDVIAFHSAQPHHGGLGSVYVMLKKSEWAKQENRERFNRKY